MSIVGSVNLQGNDVQVMPATPRVLRARGPINFTEFGYTVNGVPAVYLVGMCASMAAWAI
jgi:hypothetical protein